MAGNPQHVQTHDPQTQLPEDVQPQQQPHTGSPPQGAEHHGRLNQLVGHRVQGPAQLRLHMEAPGNGSVQHVRGCRQQQHPHGRHDLVLGIQQGENRHQEDPADADHIGDTHGAASFYFQL